MEKFQFLNKLFISLIFIFLDLRINSFDLLPDIFGYILLLYGLYQLSATLKVSTALYISIILIILGDLITYSPFTYGRIAFALGQNILFYFFIYLIFNLLFIIAKEYNYVKETKHHFTFAVITFIATTLIIIINFIHFIQPITVILAFIVTIISVIWMISLLVFIYRFKSHTLHQSKETI